jgi:hypothetical protein
MARPASNAGSPERTARKARGTRKPRIKRDPKELSKLVERLAAYIRANPGKRMDDIKVARGVPTNKVPTQMISYMFMYRESEGAWKMTGGPL